MESMQRGISKPPNTDQKKHTHQTLLPTCITMGVPLPDELLLAL